MSRVHNDARASNQLREMATAPKQITRFTFNTSILVDTIALQQRRVATIQNHKLKTLTKSKTNSVMPSDNEEQIGRAARTK
jgi:hypothetical protein